MTALEIKNISSGYGEVQILWGVSLKLEKGKLTSLVGANGVGKTTLMRTVVGLIKPSTGSVSFNGSDVTKTSAHAKAAQGLVLVPEGRQLFTDMTVSENLEMGAFTQRAKANFKRNLERVYEMFPRLKERINQKSGTMSGGEQQMLAVARGLMAQPDVLMIDELSLGLAPFLVLDLFEILKRLKDDGLTMLLVEQNVQMALAVSDYAYVLADGKVELEGPSRELAQNEHVRAAYLGI
ncbi:MAG: High-affinity branched-chain amino acid transport ATP-binding protein LivF [Anaerolineae bacterium]|nr:High-affinity branched-chain amino acid transport ATP-binding protein LivF [Anaerolineae bacterium]